MMMAPFSFSTLDKPGVGDPRAVVHTQRVDAAQASQSRVRDHCAAAHAQRVDATQVAQPRIRDSRAASSIIPQRVDMSR